MQNKQQPNKQQPKKKRRRMSNFLFLMFCLLILGGFSGFIVHQASRYNGYRAEHERIEAELANQRAIYADLRQQMDNFDSDAYIEALARDLLGWARPNELVLRKWTD